MVMVKCKTGCRVADVGALRKCCVQQCCLHPEDSLSRQRHGFTLKVRIGLDSRKLLIPGQEYQIIF